MGYNLREDNDDKIIYKCITLITLIRDNNIKTIRIINYCL